MRLDGQQGCSVSTSQLMPAATAAQPQRVTTAAGHRRMHRIAAQLASVRQEPGLVGRRKEGVATTNTCSSMSSSRRTFQILTPAQWDSYSRNGYVVVPGLIPEGLLAELTAASRRLRDRVRKGSLVHGFQHRTVGL